MIIGMSTMYDKLDLHKLLWITKANGIFLGVRLGSRQIEPLGLQFNGFLETAAVMNRVAKEIGSTCYVIGLLQPRPQTIKV